MKKTIITIILFVLIALVFVLYTNMSNNKFSKMIEKGDTSAVVQAFLDEMIPHHKEAVDSSLKVMNDLDITNSQVRIFAANVVDNQSFEMSKMENIYREFLLKEYVPTMTKDNKNPHAMMSDITALTGDELSKVYTKDMIKHHQKAIDVAMDYIEVIDKVNKSNSNSENGLVITNSHPAVDSTYDLAKEIVSTQQKEIEIMKGWYK